MRILEIIEEIYIIAGNAKHWYLDSKISERMNWLKKNER